MLLPLPGRAHHIIYRKYCFPTQLLVGQRCIGIYLHHVAGATVYDLIIQFHAVHALERLDDLQHGKTIACAEVEVFVIAFLLVVQKALQRTT